MNTNLMRMTGLVLSACLFHPGVAVSGAADGLAAPGVLRWNGAPITGPEAPAAPDTAAQLFAPSASRAAVNGGYVVDASAREAVRLFYKSIFLSSNGIASGWNGEIASCNAGTTSLDYQEATLRRINWFRAMAGVPANITLDSTFSQKAQQAALMMSANRQLNHFPTSDWICYSASGAEGAGKSNIGLGQAGPQAIAEGYLRDAGSNNSVVGHRRWMLYPQMQQMGIGNVLPASGEPQSSAVWIQDGRYGSARPTVRDDYVAWPPKGFVPYSTVYPRWSFSFADADFSGARVSMTENGNPLTTRLEQPVNGFGENTVVWFPGNYTDGMNWERPGADVTYQVNLSNVRVNGQTRSYSYTVTVFDPDRTGSDTPNLQPQGSTSLAAGQSGSYTFAAQAGVTDYQWRAQTVASYLLQDGAESGSGAFTVVTSPGYTAITSDLAATGTRAYHLAHTEPVDQILLLNENLVPNGTASLRFASRLGVSSTAQFAVVEVSADEGLSWTELFRQSGQQTGSTTSQGETSFSSRTVSLANYADKPIRLRFRYGVGGGSYYPQASAGIGWYIDDIALSGVERVSETTPPAIATGNAFSRTAAQGGSELLQVRPGLYGYFGDWSAPLRVTVLAQPVSSADCFFNWAERLAPSLFNPPAGSRSDIASLTYRFYSGSNAYLAISNADSHVWYFGGGTLRDLGHQSVWLTQAGCR